MLVYWFAYITSFTQIVGKHESPHTADVNEIQMGNAGRYTRGPKKRKKKWDDIKKNRRDLNRFCKK